MNTASIVAQLRDQRDKLDQAIRALESLNISFTSRRVGRPRRRRSRMSAAARKRLSQLLKARWAAGKMSRKKK